MKTVFTSREIAHVWAHAPADSHGRSPGNASFHGDEFKSYVTVIGRRIRHSGRVAYVLDRASFSISTSKTQARLACALSHAEVFTVREGRRGQSLRFTPAELRDHYLTRAAEMGGELPSRYARIRAQAYAAITEQIQEAQRVCRFFGLGSARVDSLLAKRAAGQATADAVMKESRAKALAAAAKLTAKQTAERIARNVAKAEKFLVEPESRGKSPVTLPAPDSVAMMDLPEALRAKLTEAVTGHNSALLARWDAGEEIALPYDAPVRLRVKGDEVETSKGARVPLDSARRAFHFAKDHRAAGWHRNGQTFAVGQYQLDSIDSEGIRAGCHRLTWPAVESFAVSQGWTKPAAV